jgi:hypothetical protein
MAIEIKKNATYNPSGSLVTAKYTPLSKPTLRPENREECKSLLKERSKFFDSRKLIQRLTLYASNWDDIIEFEKKQERAPLVIVSSNRSNWIAKNEDLPYRPLNNVPKKIGLRSVYIVVHRYEYTAYVKKFPKPKSSQDAEAWVKVIGWSFDKSSNYTELLDGAVGFGASRFAAIQFCKQLRKDTLIDKSDHLDYAWLLDDNVAKLQVPNEKGKPGEFPGLDAIEDDLKKFSDRVAAGFHGCTDAKPNVDMDKTWGRRGGTAPDPKDMDGILQQMVLWNIAYLEDKGLNFSPFYVASNEDISFTNYFNSQKIKYRYYKNVSICKKVVNSKEHDSATGTAEVKKGIKSLESKRKVITEISAYVADEAKVMDTEVKPPVEQKLWEFIKGKFSDCDLGRVQCQAVEIITSTAIGEEYLHESFLKSIFKLELEDVYKKSESEKKLEFKDPAEWL